MSLTDVMSGAGLWVFPSIALLIFVVVFGAAIWRAWSPAGEASRRRMAALPLQDDPAVPARTTNATKPEAAR